MTAAELYEIVKDDPEVWADDLLYDWNAYGYGHKREMRWYLVGGGRVGNDHAELMLEALYARATGCGVYETQSDLPEMRFATKRQHYASQHGPTRLAALRAAYRANKETKR